MPNNVDGRAVTVSVRIYERLLAIYPAGFRREYGPAMKQLFRDQCRDVWTRRAGLGFVRVVAASVDGFSQDFRRGASFKP